MHSIIKDLIVHIIMHKTLLEYFRVRSVEISNSNYNVAPQTKGKSKVIESRFTSELMYSSYLGISVQCILLNTEQD